VLVPQAVEDAAPILVLAFLPCFWELRERSESQKGEGEGLWKGVSMFE
jgi:hypothetical protein